MQACREIESYGEFYFLAMNFEREVHTGYKMQDSKDITY